MQSAFLATDTKAGRPGELGYHVEKVLLASGSMSLAFARNAGELADEVANELLFRTGKMLATGETHWIEGCFLLPQSVETIDGKRVLYSEACVVEVFEKLRAFYKANRVIDVVRTVVSAELLAPDLIGMIHVARLMRANGEPFRAPYPVYSVIRKTCGTWKIASTLYAILDSDEHNSLLCDANDV